MFGHADYSSVWIYMEKTGLFSWLLPVKIVDHKLTSMIN